MVGNPGRNRGAATVNVQTTAIAVLILVIGPLFAQGMDSTPAERQLRILAEMLPGHYSNANQAYFDLRRKLPEAARHGKL